LLTEVAHGPAFDSFAADPLQGLPPPIAAAIARALNNEFGGCEAATKFLAALEAACDEAHW
jgi:hypothetical protein